MNLDWQIKHYSDLTLNEFHDIVALRINVFVVEQDCPYQDLDGKDKKCYHLVCRNGKGTIGATARILPPGLSHDECSIGRVVIDERVRGKGIGHVLMKECIIFSGLEFGNAPIIVSAQKYLENYYKAHNFIPTGKEYLEDGVPHIELIRSPI